MASFGPRAGRRNKKRCHWVWIASVISFHCKKLTFACELNVRGRSREVLDPVKEKCFNIPMRIPLFRELLLRHSHHLSLPTCSLVTCDSESRSLKTVLTPPCKIKQIITFLRIHQSDESYRPLVNLNILQNFNMNLYRAAKYQICCQVYIKFGDPLELWSFCNAHELKQTLQIPENQDSWFRKSADRNYFEI